LVEETALIWKIVGEMIKHETTANHWFFLFDRVGGDPDWSVGDTHSTAGGATAAQ
jgi:hypothetical protein